MAEFGGQTPEGGPPPVRQYRWDLSYYEVLEDGRKRNLRINRFWQDGFCDECSEEVAMMVTARYNRDWRGKEQWVQGRREYAGLPEKPTPQEVKRRLVDQYFSEKQGKWIHLLHYHDEEIWDEKLGRFVPYEGSAFQKSFDEVHDQALLVILGPEEFKKEKDQELRKVETMKKYPLAFQVEFDPDEYKPHPDSAAGRAAARGDAAAARIKENSKAIRP